MREESCARVFSLDDCVALREEARSLGKVVVLTNGCFDLLHRGHLDYLEHSAGLGDLLIVAVNSDESVRALKGDSRPLNPAVDRVHALGCLRFVDAAFIFQGLRLMDEIRALRPDIYTKAGDYTLGSLDSSEREALQEVGSAIRIQPLSEGYSTTSLAERLHTSS